MAIDDWKALIGAKTFDELRLDAFERWKASGSKITNLNVGGLFRTLLELAMQGLADLHALLINIAPKGILKYSDGTWTVLKAEELGVYQKLDQKAEGMVIFGRSNTSGNKLIQAGSVIKTDLTINGEELRYFVTADCICKDGVAEIAAPVIAEFTGVKYNVGQGVIKNMVTHVSGFDYVTNPSDWLTKEGADIEDIEILKERCRLRWYEVGVGAPALYYKSLAMSVIGVTDVEVADQHPRGPGTVDVIIMSTAGLPTQTLIDTVQTLINSKRMTLADVLVRAPLQTEIDITVTIYLYPESNADSDSIQSSAVQVINAYFGVVTLSGVNRLKLSQDFIRLNLAEMIKNISPTDIKNVIFTSPATDITINSGYLGIIGDISITVEKAAEL